MNSLSRIAALIAKEFTHLGRDRRTLAVVLALPEDMLRRPGAFGPAQHAPVGSSPTTVLMVFLGRSVDSSS